MTRVYWMLSKSWVSAAAVAVGSLVVAFRLKGLAANPWLGELAQWAPWVALIGLAVAVAMAAAPVVRLWRWQRGEGPMCHRCSGPLGHEIQGRYGPFRRCLACHGTTPSRHYA